MNLRKATKDEYKVIRALYNSAFPRNERAPFSFMWRRALQNRGTLLVAEENGEFFGFAYTIGYRDLVYLFYFAVAEDKRGKGTGSEILRLIKTYYVDKIIFLAREPLDDTAENNQERINRRSFYINNGFKDLPFQIREASVIYDVMSTVTEIAPPDYNTLIQNWAGKLVSRLVKMKLIE